MMGVGDLGREESPEANSHVVVARQPTPGTGGGFVLPLQTHFTALRNFFQTNPTTAAAPAHLTRDDVQVAVREAMAAERAENQRLAQENAPVPPKTCGQKWTAAHTKLNSPGNFKDVWFYTASFFGVAMGSVSACRFAGGCGADDGGGGDDGGGSDDGGGGDNGGGDSEDEPEPVSMYCDRLSYLYSCKRELEGEVLTTFVSCCLGTGSCDPLLAHPNCTIADEGPEPEEGEEREFTITFLDMSVPYLSHQRVDCGGDSQLMLSPMPKSRFASCCVDPAIVAADPAEAEEQCGTVFWWKELENPSSSRRSLAAAQGPACSCKCCCSNNKLAESGRKSTTSRASTRRTSKWQSFKDKVRSSRVYQNGRTAASTARKYGARMTGVAAAVGLAASFAGLFMAPAREFPDPPPLSDPIEAEAVEQSFSLLQLSISKITSAIKSLVDRFSMLLGELEEDPDPEDDAFANAAPALWDSIYHEIMDSLEYDLALCQPLVPNPVDAAQRRRALAEKLAVRGGPVVRTVDPEMRRALKSKSELEKEVDDASQELEAIRQEHFAAQSRRWVSCGHFRSALRQITLWGKAIHEGMIELFDIARRMYVLEGKLGIQQSVTEQAAESMETVLFAGADLADQMRRKQPISASDFSRDLLLQELGATVFETELQEHMMGVHNDAEQALAQFCSSARYVNPELFMGNGSAVVLRNACSLVLDVQIGIGSTGLAMSELASRLGEVTGVMEDSLFDLMSSAVPSLPQNMRLEVTELIDMDLFRAEGVANFSLAGPAGGASLRDGSSQSAAFARGGPFFCSDSRKFDNVMMERVGVLYLDKQNKVLGPKADIDSSDEVKTTLRLSGPFRKTRLGESFEFLLPDFNVATYYNLPTDEGFCETGAANVLGLVCFKRDSFISEEKRMLPTPYAQWSMHAVMKTEYRERIHRVVLLADLKGLDNDEMQCRPETTLYMLPDAQESPTPAPTTPQQPTPPVDSPVSSSPVSSSPVSSPTADDEAGGSDTTTLAAIVGASVAFVLVGVGVAVVRQRTKLKIAQLQANGVLQHQDVESESSNPKFVESSDPA
mmetsp:Transcript_18970/g.60647  ORF Transcript_18970/g.60647 Transcript_18970/m.60647 type:complete len:1065 (-) Transcript_18970:1635-4829(-)